MKKRMILFDLDGTLIDSRADLATATNLVRADYGLPPLSLATITGYVGDGVNKLLQRALQDAQPGWSLAEAVQRMGRHYHDHLLDETCLYPGVAETLPLLARQWQLGVVTNKPQAHAEAICEKLGVADAFAVLLGGGRCAQLKPRPEPLLLALELAGASREDSWMVGDHRTDLGAASAAGLRACFCAYGFGRQDAQRADAIIQHFAQLPKVLGAAER
jgi:phosphoglycolate phosphatase